MYSQFVISNIYFPIFLWKISQVHNTNHNTFSKIHWIFPCVPIQSSITCNYHLTNAYECKKQYKSCQLDTGCMECLTSLSLTNFYTSLNKHFYNPHWLRMPFPKLCCKCFSYFFSSTYDMVIVSSSEMPSKSFTNYLLNKTAFHINSHK